jgi:hypothetical protein
MSSSGDDAQRRKTNIRLPKPLIDRVVMDRTAGAHKIPLVADGLADFGDIIRALLSLYAEGVDAAQRKRAVDSDGIMDRIFLAPPGAVIGRDLIATSLAQAKTAIEAKLGGETEAKVWNAIVDAFTYLEAPGSFAYPAQNEIARALLSGESPPSNCSRSPAFWTAWGVARAIEALTSVGKLDEWFDVASAKHVYAGDPASYTESEMAEFEKRMGFRP